MRFRNFVFFIISTSSALARPINYGSIIQLQHAQTGNMIFSMPKVTWGSGGQIVSVMPSKMVKDDLKPVGWIVRSPASQSKSLSAEAIEYFSSTNRTENKSKTAFTTHMTGTSVLCNSHIRLEHAESSRTLYASTDTSPITHNYEVVAVDPKERNGNNDLFEVICENEAKNSKRIWNTGENFRLKHVKLGEFLMADKQAEFSHSNCPRCPIINHIEISVDKGMKKKHADYVRWKAHTVMAISLPDEDELDDSNKGRNDEL